MKGSSRFHDHNINNKNMNVTFLSMCYYVTIMGQEFKTHLTDTLSIVSPLLHLNDPRAESHAIVELKCFEHEVLCFYLLFFNRKLH